MNANRAEDLIFGGWHLGGIITMHTGFYFTPEMSFDPSNTGSNGLYRTNQVCNGNLSSGQRTIDNWFDIDCFPLPDDFTFGNAGKNILEGPGAVKPTFHYASCSTLLNPKTLSFASKCSTPSIIQCSHSRIISSTTVPARRE